MSKKKRLKCVRPSQSPQVSLISIRAKGGVALMQCIRFGLLPQGEMQGGFSASSEDQFLGVKMKSVLLTPGLRTRRAASPAAPVWHGQSFSDQCTSHILTVDEQ